MLDELRTKYKQRFIVNDYDWHFKVEDLCQDIKCLLTLAGKQEAVIQCKNETIAEKGDSIAELYENLELCTETVEEWQKEYAELQEVTKFWAAQAGTFCGKLHNLEQEFEHKDKELNAAISFYRAQIVHAQEDIVILEANLARKNRIIGHLLVGE